jgi:hypothetical protein
MKLAIVLLVSFCMQSISVNYFNMKKQALRNILGASLLAAMLAVASSAQAITFNITSDHSTGQKLGTAPYGTVELVQSGANVNFTVDLIAGYRFVQTGAADNLYFKFNGIGITAADITSELPSPIQGFAGSFNGDGTGAFGFGVGVTDGSGNEQLDAVITFTVLGATIAELTVPNANGIIFVADIIAPNGTTGPADVTAPGVPDGGTTLLLLGSALTGFALLRRKLGMKV